MALLRPFRAGLAAKLAICVVASTAAFFALFGYLNLGEQRRQSEEMVLQEADRISDVIRRSTRYEMLHNDREALYNNINEIGGEPGIRRIRIFNKEGRIRFSTDPREVNTLVDKKTEACYGCHSQRAPLTRLARPDRARIFPDGKGGRLLGVIRPIENAPECSNAACHSHPAGQRVLGVIDANLSLAAVDAQLAAHRAHLLWFTLAVMVLGSVFSVAFVLLVVYRPVKALIAGTHRVAAGDLSYRIPVRTEDELGELAESFNKMTARVEGVHAEIEEQVRRKTRELEQAHKAILRTEKMASIGKLAATVAHEINNPLFGILTYARLILRELDKGERASREEMSDQLHTIERESRRCGDLVKNLLTFARQAPSHRDAHHLTTIVERAVSLVKHKLDMQGVELKLDLDPEAPPVLCDAGQIQQVVLVLMVNAAEAMAQGGRLEVSIGHEGETVSLRVRDTGSGIPADVLPQIFEPFFTTKEDQQRTGLGLAVAHSIVEQHGGEISVKSVPGEGTEFTVTLPAGTPAGDEAALEETGAGRK